MTTDLVFVADSHMAIPILIHPDVKRCLTTTVQTSDDGTPVYEVALFCVPKIDTAATRTMLRSIDDFNARMTKHTAIPAEWQSAMKRRCEAAYDPNHHELYVREYNMIDETNVAGHWISPIILRDVPGAEEEQAFAYCRFKPNPTFPSVLVEHWLCWTTSLRALCTHETHLDKLVYTMGTLVTIDIM